MRKKLSKIVFSGKFMALWIAQIGICGVAGIISGLAGFESLFVLFAFLTFGSLFIIGLITSYLEKFLDK